jgi:hypothetical protein
MKATEIIFFLTKKPIGVSILTPEMKKERGRANAVTTWIQAGMLMLAIGHDIQMIIFGLIALGMSIATIDRRRIKIIK